MSIFRQNSYAPQNTTKKNLVWYLLFNDSEREQWKIPNFQASFEDFTASQWERNVFLVYRTNSFAALKLSIHRVHWHWNFTIVFIRYKIIICVPTSVLLSDDKYKPFLLSHAPLKIQWAKIMAIVHQFRQINLTVHCVHTVELRWFLILLHLKVTVWLLYWFGNLGRQTTDMNRNTIRAI